MPIYRYACPDCGHEFEQRQKFTDEPIKRCPNCERRHVYRLVNQVAVSFKGSGWYITDSKSSDIQKVKHKGDEPSPNGKDGDTAKEPATGAATGAASGASGAASGEGQKSSPATETAKSDSGARPDKPAKAGDSGRKA